MKVPDKIASVTALYDLFNLKKPLHPLISMFYLSTTGLSVSEIAYSWGLNIHSCFIVYSRIRHLFLQYGSENHSISRRN